MNACSDIRSSGWMRAVREKWGRQPEKHQQNGRDGNGARAANCFCGPRLERAALRNSRRSREDGYDGLSVGRPARWARYDDLGGDERQSLNRAGLHSCSLDQPKETATADRPEERSSASVRFPDALIRPIHRPGLVRRRGGEPSRYRSLFRRRRPPPMEPAPMADQSVGQLIAEVHPHVCARRFSRFSLAKETRPRHANTPNELLDVI
jgi:hypothetical protein